MLTVRNYQLCITTLEVLKTYLKNRHVKIFSDSQVGIQAINEMGTTESLICNSIVKNIQLFYVKNEIRITAAHISGAENVVADYESRKSQRFRQRLFLQFQSDQLSIGTTFFRECCPRNHTRLPHTKKIYFYHKNQKNCIKNSHREGVREVFLSQGFDNNTVDILIANWRKGTFSNYPLYMRMV